VTGLAFALLLVLCYVPVPVKADAPSPALTAWSFAACSADPLCELAFPAGGDPDVFEAMLTYYLNRRSDSGTAMQQFLEPCASGVLAAGINCTYTCLEVEQMWVWQLRGVALCGINYEWIPAYGCLCMEGRTCTADCIAARSTDMWSLFAAVIAFAVGAAAAIAWILFKQQREIRETRNCQEHVRTTLQTDDAVRFVYARPAANASQFGINRANV
jgi:hypothetical protein